MQTPDTPPHVALMRQNFDISVGTTAADDRIIWRSTRQPASVVLSDGTRAVLLGVFVLDERAVMAALISGKWAEGVAPLDISLVPPSTYHAAQMALSRSTARIERAAVARAKPATVGGSGVRHG